MKYIIKNKCEILVLIFLSVHNLLQYGVHCQKKCERLRLNIFCEFTIWCSIMYYNVSKTKFNVNLDSILLPFKKCNNFLVNQPKSVKYTYR